MNEQEMFAMVKTAWVLYHQQQKSQASELYLKQCCDAYHRWQQTLIVN